MIEKIKLKVSSKLNKDSNNSLDEKPQKNKSFSSPPTNFKFSNYFLFLFVILNFFERVSTNEQQSGKMLNKSNLVFEF